MFEGLIFPTKLVDLPNIIEAQKTLNGKQMYKIADISQMLIIDGTPEPQPPRADGNFSGLPLPPMKPSEYTWPDGLSMALKNVRRRRFRKRVSKAVSKFCLTLVLNFFFSFFFPDRIELLTLSYFPFIF